MAKDRLSGKLAVILHADVAGSTQLVQQDEQLAHERIQDDFRRFSDTVGKYHGRVQELRGDALLAEFERASDAVTAALSFQSDHRNHLDKIEGRCPEVVVSFTNYKYYFSNTAYGHVVTRLALQHLLVTPIIGQQTQTAGRAQVVQKLLLPDAVLYGFQPALRPESEEFSIVLFLLPAD